MAATNLGSSGRLGQHQRSFATHRPLAMPDIQDGARGNRSLSAMVITATVNGD